MATIQSEKTLVVKCIIPVILYHQPLLFLSSLPFSIGGAIASQLMRSKGRQIAIRSWRENAEESFSENTNCTVESVFPCQKPVLMYALV